MLIKGALGLHRRCLSYSTSSRNSDVLKIITVAYIGLPWQHKNQTYINVQFLL